MTKEDIEENIESISNGNYEDFSTHFNHEDFLDTYDLQARIDELQSEYDDLVEAYQDAHSENAEEYSEESFEEARENISNWFEENLAEFATLLKFKEEICEYTTEWDCGETIINDDHFEDYAKQLAEDCGMIDRYANWPLNHIDWAGAADALKDDYSSVDIDGKTYWVRSC